MSESSYPPFLKWGEFKSDNPKNPDEIEIKTIETDTFETEYSINVLALRKEKKKWVEFNLPLKSHDSANASLLNQWMSLVKSGKIKKGTILRLKTWMGTSKNGRAIRRFELGS